MFFLCCQCGKYIGAEKSIDYVQIIGVVLIPIAIALFSFYIAKRQIIGAGVTQFRQRWINSLRNSISDFIAKAEYLALEIKENKREDQLIIDLYQDLLRLRFKIELMLNPKENDHKEIIRLLIKIRNDIYDKNIPVTNIQSDILLLTQTTKDVLKREWEVVKGGN